MRVISKKSFTQETTLSLFRKAVYTVVSKIPKGAVMTYAEVAKKMGNPLAVRAVGTTLSKNCFLDVPCHRVVRSDGSIGEYAFGGPKAKGKRLLEEGIQVDKNGRVAFPS